MTIFVEKLFIMKTRASEMERKRREREQRKPEARARKSFHA